MKKKNCTLYYITALGKFVGLLPVPVPVPVPVARG